jgi:pimeloyl-ACP methyl ester carboxylesterase
MPWRLPAAALAVALMLHSGGPFASEPALAGDDLASIPPPGRIVMVEGRQVHIHCTGAGSPTVVLEEGLGGSSLNWAWVQRYVAEVSRVCSYDRPGYGWSDPADTPMDAANTSRQLYALLQAAGEKGPYIAVGHSLGGAYMRLFAAEHRKDVAGLVLVDAIHPSALTEAGEMGLQPIIRKEDMFTSFLTSNEITWQMARGLGIAKTSYDDSWKDLPSDVKPAVAAFITDRRTVTTFFKENGSLADTINQIASLDSLRNLPVTVISSDKFKHPDPATAMKLTEWVKKIQRKWLAISTKSHFQIIPEADHMSLLLVSQHASQVSKAITDIVVAVRKRSPHAAAGGEMTAQHTRL